ncbi:MAG: redox-regulated ATPase YchF [Nitrososphaerales archaeon]
MLVGIIGKPNSGKSTFFSAATLVDVPIANYPFTTIKPNIGIAYVRVKCVCKELKVKDNPINSFCIDGNRFVPVKMVDVAGLVPGASKGRGLGNKFLDDLRQADALIHVVDISGKTDSEGRICEYHDPLKDIEFVEEEFDLWVNSIIEKDWPKIIRRAEAEGEKIEALLAEKLSGLSIKERDIIEALALSNLKGKNPTKWGEKELFLLVKNIRKVSKPMLIAANKVDLSSSKENIEALKRKNINFIPCSSEAELLLKKASKKGLVKYIPGDKDFEIEDESRLTEAQRNSLNLVREKVLKVWGSTGVQEIVNSAFLRLLGAVAVYPVEDENNFSDKKGNVLPDCYLMKRNSTAIDLANTIHSDLAKGFLYAIDAKRKVRLPSDYVLKDSDVIKIVSTTRRG